MGLSLTDPTFPLHFYGATYYPKQLSSSTLHQLTIICICTTPWKILTSTESSWHSQACESLPMKNRVNAQHGHHTALSMVHWTSHEPLLLLQSIHSLYLYCMSGRYNRILPCESATSPRSCLKTLSYMLPRICSMHYDIQSHSLQSINWENLNKMPSGTLAHS